MKKIFVIGLIFVGLFLGFTQVFGAEIFGDNTIGNITAGISVKTGLKAYLPIKSEISKISVYTRKAGFFGNVQTAIYDESGNLKGTSEAKTLGNDWSWVEFNFEPPIILDGGWYWLMIKSDGDILYYRVTKILSNALVCSHCGYIFPDPVNLGNCEFFNDTSASIYATYEPLPPPPTFLFVETSINFVTSTLAYIGQAVTGSGPLLYMVIGIPLGFWVLNQVIGLVPRRKTKRE